MPPFPDRIGFWKEMSTMIFVDERDSGRYPSRGVSGAMRIQAVCCYGTSGTAVQGV